MSSGVGRAGTQDPGILARGTWTWQGPGPGGDPDLQGRGPGPPGAGTWTRRGPDPTGTGPGPGPSGDPAAGTGTGTGVQIPDTHPQNPNIPNLKIQMAIPNLQICQMAIQYPKSRIWRTSKQTILDSISGLGQFLLYMVT